MRLNHLDDKVIGDMNNNIISLTAEEGEEIKESSISSDEDDMPQASMLWISMFENSKVEKCKPIFMTMSSNHHQLITSAKNLKTKIKECFVPCRY